MRPPAWGLARVLGELVLLVASGAAVVGVAPAQPPSPFTITFTVDRSQPGGGVRLVGRVVNEGRLEARNLTLTGEALDASGNLVASGAAYVGTVPERGTALFAIPMPQNPRAVSYRVVVTGYQLGFGQPQARAPVTPTVLAGER
jgi:hypothetical protein